MKSKLHFGLLIILFTFLGRYIESSTLPNQQIVIQFSDTQITEKDAQDAINSIQLKLHSIGAQQIQIGQDHQGKLKITYYSNTDIEQIQNVLSGDEDFKFAYDSGEGESNNLPNSKNVKDYELNISEIQKGNDTNWDFEGVEVVELNQKSDRFNNLKVNTSGDQTDSRLINGLIKVSISTTNNVAAAIDHISYKIPEVRAGPLV